MTYEVVKRGATVFVSEANTRGVRVVVQSRYVAERSDPVAGHWFFAYTVQVSNEGTETVQLVSRHWVITDANSRVEEVEGPGVVGEQPVLEPGQMFEYMSGCPLPTPFGTMEGAYQMVTDEGEHFDAVIAPFSLAEPLAVN
jgi:ApaG protein